MTAEVGFNIKALDRSSSARRGSLKLGRGVVETPVFMPVGTQAAVRGLPPRFFPEIPITICLANTYHLHQRPGESLVKKLGGLHSFMNVDVPILTDSGGFQVFSLKKKKVSEEGVAFAYELDGRKTFLSPEVSMQIQMDLGADIAMAFDECLHADAEYSVVQQSVDLTARWAERCLKAHTDPNQSLFGIVQGGMFSDLRKRSMEQITSLPFDAFALGGLAVGEGPEVMNNVLAATCGLMPPDKPRYLMGVGRPQDLVDGVAHGVDMFDCVIPTRHARGGVLYTFQGRMRVTQARYRRDGYPPDTSCRCYTCQNFSRAYLNHLFSIGEPLALTLSTLHNLTFFYDLMEGIRTSIENGTFGKYRKDIKALYPESTPQSRDEEEATQLRDAAKRQGDERFANRSTSPVPSERGRGRSGRDSTRSTSKKKDGTKGRGNRGKKRPGKR
jgi:queuine tRNA-ribosyltransferase